MGSVIFGGLKNLNFNICLGFQKNKYLFRYEVFMDIFCGHHKIGIYLGVISILLRVIFQGQGTDGGIFWGR